MSKRYLYLDGDSPFGPEGEIHGKTFIRHTTEFDHFSLGIRMTDDLLDKLIDENIESIVHVHDGKRYTSLVEDWQGYGRPGSQDVEDGDHYYTYLPFTYMMEA